jgi:hypothetical protein
LGTGGNGPIKAMFSYGKKDYYLGNHPLWELFRVGYRTFKKPYQKMMILLNGSLNGEISKTSRFL